MKKIEKILPHYYYTHTHTRDPSLMKMSYFVEIILKNSKSWYKYGRDDFESSEYTSDFQFD